MLDNIGTNITLNIVELNWHISRLNELKKSMINSKNDYNRVSRMVRDVMRLKQFSMNGICEIVWCMSDGVIKHYPSQMDVNDKYGIDLIRCVVSDKPIYRIKTEWMAELMALELMVYDLEGEDFDEKLSSVDLLTIHNASDIEDIFGDGLYEASSYMRIENSPYMICKKLGKCVINDYFYSKVHVDDRYADVVSYSCKRAMSIIVAEIVKKVTYEGIDLSMIHLSDREATFIINEAYKEKAFLEIMKDINVVMQTLGRKFDIGLEIERLR